MALLKPDPTFHASPGEAAAGAAGDPRLRRHAEHGHERRQAPDALCVVDLDPSSSSYGTVVGRLDMPNARRRAAPLRLERLLVGAVPVGRAPARRAALPADPRPALVADPRRRRQGRPAPAEAREGHRGRRDRPQGRLQPPAHHPLRPRRDLRQRARRARRRRPRRHLPARPRELLASRAPGSRTAARRSWPTTSGGTSAYDTVVTSEWGTPNMVEDGLIGELLLGNKYGHQLHVWDCKKRTPPAGARPRRRAPDGARAAPGPRPDATRTASSAWSSRPPTCRRRSGCGAAPTTARSARRRSSRSRPSRPRPTSCRRCCSRSARCRRSSPTSRCRSTTRSLFVSCWGTGEIKRYDVTDPDNPRETGSRAAGRHRRAHGAPRRGAR